MNFTICTERYVTMVLDVKFVTEDDLARAEMVGDTILHRKIIEPHDDMVKEVDEHNLREVSVRESADDPPTMFLDDPNPAFDVTDVFRSCWSV